MVMRRFFRISFALAVLCAIPAAPALLRTAAAEAAEAVAAAAVGRRWRCDALPAGGNSAGIPMRFRQL